MTGATALRRWAMFCYYRGSLRGWGRCQQCNATASYAFGYRRRFGPRRVVRVCRDHVDWESR